MKTETRNALLAGIADQRLNLQTLETRNSDSLDFPTLAVWQIKAALEAAFEAGREAASAKAEPATEMTLVGRKVRRASVIEVFDSNGLAFVRRTETPKGKPARVFSWLTDRTPDWFMEFNKIPLAEREGK
jgi:hypothetical protein